MGNTFWKIGLCAVAMMALGAVQAAPARSVAGASTGGNSPYATDAYPGFDGLDDVKKPERREKSWWFGVKRDTPAEQFAFAQELETEGDSKGAAKAYDAAILAAGGIDLQLLGIGFNGHIAFNDPPADFEASTAYCVVQLDQVCRMQQVGEGWYPNLDAVPTHAYSMTVPQIMAAKSIAVIVPDDRKARAVAMAVDGPLTNMCPSSILRNHADCTLFLDPPAASRLRR